MCGGSLIEEGMQGRRRAVPEVGVSDELAGAATVTRRPVPGLDVAYADRVRVVVGQRLEERQPVDLAGCFGGRLAERDVDRAARRLPASVRLGAIDADRWQHGIRYEIGCTDLLVVREMA